MLCSNIVLFYSGILPCYWYIISMQVLILCSNYAQFVIESCTQSRTNNPPTGIPFSLLFILTVVTEGQNVTVLMLVDSCSCNWLWLIYWLPLWRFAHVPCYYSSIMLKLFWVAIIIPIITSFPFCKWWECTEACTVLKGWQKLCSSKTIIGLWITVTVNIWMLMVTISTLANFCLSAKHGPLQ